LLARGGEHGRRFQSIGTADDVTEADGEHVLSFAQGQEAARKWFADLARQDRGEIRGGPYTVAQCLREYVTWFHGHRKTGWDVHHRVFTHLLPKLGEIQCDRLTTAEIQKWLRDLANTPALLRSRKDAKKRNVRALDKGDADAIRRRRSSANRTLTVLKAALNRAWREGKVRSDEAWRRVEPFEEADAARVRYLTVAEAKRLLNACDPDFRAMAQAALVTGARYGELAALRVADFNPDSGTVHVRTSNSGRGATSSSMMKGRPCSSRSPPASRAMACCCPRPTDRSGASLTKRGRWPARATGPGSRLQPRFTFCATRGPRSRSWPALRSW
jgi:Phage integrase family